jgi:hypothetical protein
MTPIQRSIIKTLAYFSIFKHPLKIDELHRFLLFNKCTIDELREEISELKSKGIVFEIDKFFLLENNKNWIVNRIKGEKLARKFWKIAKFMSHIIKRFPFVRAIFISGSLAKFNVTKSTDIDFFIITKPKRLWLTRSFLIAFKKVFLLNKKKFFCINYFITDDHLEIEDKNIFTAMEIASVKPIFNSDIYLQFIEANSWIKDFIPNFYVSQSFNTISNRPSLIQSALEGIFEFSLNYRKNFLDRFDSILMNKWKEIWRRRYPNLTDEKRDLMFRCRAYVSKAHPNDFQSFVLQNYDKKIKALLNDEEI